MKNDTAKGSLSTSFFFLQAKGRFAGLSAAAPIPELDSSLYCSQRATPQSVLWRLSRERGWTCPKSPPSVSFEVGASSPIRQHLASRISHLSFVRG